MNTCILPSAFTHCEEDAPSQPDAICDQHSGRIMLRRNVRSEEMKCIDCSKKIQREQILIRKYFVTRRDATVPRVTLREPDPCWSSGDVATRGGRK
jgi:hypothetical protein